MGQFDRKYTDDQVEAATHAYIDRDIKPQRRVLEMAEAGQLITRDGRKVRPFTMSKYTLRDYIRRERRRRLGGGKASAIENPDGVLEGMRRRMISVAEAELHHWERQRAGKRDPDQLRQITRLMREIAALPAIGEGRSKTPGAKVDGQRTDAETKGGLAGSLLAAHRQSRPAPEPLTDTHTQAENATQRSTSVQTQTHEQDQRGPGSLQRSAAEGQSRDTELRLNAGWVAR